MLPNGLTIDRVHYYQGVLLVEVALTLILYFVLKVVHYIKWGHSEETGAVEEKEASKPGSQQGEGEVKQGEPENAEGATESRKWDQKAWNVYFPIIFAYHLGAISLTLVYNPYIYSAVIGFLHFLCFVTLIILNIFIKDVEPGNGSRTKGTRAVWGIMGLFNLMLIIGGLAGVAGVLQ